MLMLNLIISTIAFFVAAWYVNRYLDEQEILEGRTRRILVMVLATAVSMGVGKAVDYFDPPPAKQSIFAIPAAPPQPKVGTD
jgi:hypothetical protein